MSMSITFSLGTLCQLNNKNNKSEEEENKWREEQETCVISWCDADCCSLSIRSSQSLLLLFWGGFSPFNRRQSTDEKWERREWPSAGLNARTVHTATDRRRVATSPPPPPTTISLSLSMCGTLLTFFFFFFSKMKNIWKIGKKSSVSPFD